MKFKGLFLAALIIAATACAEPPTPAPEIFTSPAELAAMRAEGGRKAEQERQEQAKVQAQHDADRAREARNNTPDDYPPPGSDAEDALIRASLAGEADPCPSVRRIAPMMREPEHNEWIAAHCSLAQPESYVAKGECDPVCQPDERVWPCPEYTCPAGTDQQWIQAANMRECQTARGVPTAPVSEPNDPKDDSECEQRRRFARAQRLRHDHDVKRREFVDGPSAQ